MAAQKGLPKTTIEFIPQEDWEKTNFGKFLKWLLNVGRWIVIVTELIVILAFLSRFKLDRDLTNLNETVKQKQAVVIASSEFEKEFRFLQKRLSTIEGLKKSQIEAGQILDVFAQLTPRGVQLSNFSLADKKVSLTATADSEFTLAAFLNSLKQSPKIEKLAISKISTDAEHGLRINFNLKTELKEEK